MPGPKKVTTFQMAVVFAMYGAGTGTGVWVANNIGGDSIPYTLEGELELTATITAQAFTLELERRCNDEALRQEMLDNWPVTLQPLATVQTTPSRATTNRVGLVPAPSPTAAPSPTEIHAALTDPPVTLLPYGEYLTFTSSGHSSRIPQSHRHHCPHGCPNIPGDLVTDRVLRCPACLQSWTVSNWGHIKRDTDGYRYPHEIAAEQRAAELGYPDAAAMHREESYKYELEQAVNTLVTLLEQR